METPLLGCKVAYSFGGAMKVSTRYLILSGMLVVVAVSGWSDPIVQNGLGRRSTPEEKKDAEEYYEPRTLCLGLHDSTIYKYQASELCKRVRFSKDFLSVLFQP